MSGAEIVTTYLGAVRTHDWVALRDCLADDVVRVGPFRDEYRGRDAYVAFLTELMPALPGYAMDIADIREAGPSRCYAELTETVTVDGSPLVTEEVLVFDLDDDVDARIARIDIYIKTAAPGSAASARS